MATSPKRLAWDSCAWIAHIQEEKLPSEDRGAMCRAVISAAEKGLTEIVVSAFALTEVLCKNRAAGIDDGKVRDFFDNDYILLVAADKYVCDIARALMLAGHAGLKPPDAVHIATAIISNADEFHTFDAKLLALDAVIDKMDSTKLKIRKPTLPAAPAPLLDRDKDESE
jgi:predicted nucleic acid-binding protein